MRLIVFVVSVALLIASPARAQDVSLIEILVAKGVLSKEEARKLRGNKDGKAEQAALISVLKAKGILDEHDVEQLQTPPVVTATPEVRERLQRLESQQQTFVTQAQTQAEQQAKAVEELKKRGIEIARRTVVKYRQQLDIPPARRRKVHGR